MSSACCARTGERGLGTSDPLPGRKLMPSSAFFGPNFSCPAWGWIESIGGKPFRMHRA